MTEPEITTELRSLYEQSQYVLKFLRGMASTIDAVLRTLLESPESAPRIQQAIAANLSPGDRPPYLPNTQELFRGLDVQLLAIDLKIRMLEQK
jgi:hypothetical protein